MLDMMHFEDASRSGGYYALSGAVLFQQRHGRQPESSTIETCEIWITSWVCCSDEEQ